MRVGALRALGFFHRGMGSQRDLANSKIIIDKNNSLIEISGELSDI